MKTELTTRKLSHRLATPLAHTLVIVIVFILPELVMAFVLPHKRTFAFYPGFYVKTLIFIAAFYINYNYIIERTIGRTGARRGLLSFLLINLGVIVVGLALDYIVSVNFLPSPKHHDNNDPALSLWESVIKRLPFLTREAVMMVLTIGLAVALRLSVLWKDSDRARQDLIASQRASELDSLKNQLNPHFLFNTLNTIYALVDISPDDAKQALHRLSGMLRYMLYEDVTNVRLEREAAFISDYVAMMKLRMPSRSIDVDIDLHGNEEIEVPPLLFIPLIENAFKHGNTATDSEPIRITLKADHGTVRCTTSNSYAPDREEAGHDSKASGIGLANLRRRLQLLYGTSSQLTTDSNGGIFTASLTIDTTQHPG